MRDPLLLPLHPAPLAEELPSRLPSPFAQGPLHPLAARAVRELLRDLPAWPREGKMLGVLVARAPDGAIGVLRGFSGMLDGKWRQPGFVPPLFDEAARASWWDAAQAELARLDAELRELRDGPQTGARERRWAELVRAQEHERAALGEAHRARKAERAQARAALEGPIAEVAARRHALDQQSRGDAAERRALDEAHRVARHELAREREAHVARVAALQASRARRSAAYQARLFDEVRVPSAAGGERLLRELFAPSEPPSGAGDCAGPKLLGYALRRALTPLVLAEVWWGPPPPSGGRHHGQCYPACRGKCGPILPHLLAGLPVDEAPLFGAAPARAELTIVYEDDWLVVVDKPAGLLSVPGRSPALSDSVATRLGATRPGARLAHRLDLDTSGLVVAAKDSQTYVQLQRAFSERRVSKRYLAWLDGEVVNERGLIELALRTDVDDRPRQVVDAVHGKPARTRFAVLARAAGRTLVALWPETGRTHQLRVHAAHPAGLGAPIVGDPLYGRAPAPRLLLHAAELSLVHPRSGASLAVSSAPPFPLTSAPGSEAAAER